MVIICIKRGDLHFEHIKSDCFKNILLFCLNSFTLLIIVRNVDKLHPLNISCTILVIYNINSFVTMRARHSDKKFSHYLQFAMYSILEWSGIFLIRILRVTISKLLWTCSLFILLYLLWTWHSNNVEESENPVILWWTGGFPGTHETRQCPNNIKCDVFINKSLIDAHYVEAYLFYASDINFDVLPLPRKPRDVIWGLYHEESPRNIEQLLHEEALKLFNFSSTFSRFSNVPFPLQHFESLNRVTSKEYFVPTKKKDEYLKEIAPILYLQTDCETSTERDAYVKELMKYIKIDSYGKCLNNKEFPEKFTEDYLNKLNDDEFLKFIARYKFVIAIENGVCNDYVTEKFWRAINVGVVPIYFGSPSIRDWLPNEKSVILLEDYPSPKTMSEYVKKLLSNDDLYDEHLQHKIKGIINNERLAREFITRGHQTHSLKVVEEFECFICKKLHEKRNMPTDGYIVTKSHYNCPKPLSALTLQVNPTNHWVYSWNTAKEEAKEIYKRVMD